MMEAARQDVLARHEGRTSMYTCTGADWRQLGGENQAKHLLGLTAMLYNVHVYTVRVQEQTGASWEVRTKPNI